MPARQEQLRWDSVADVRPGLFGARDARASLLFHPIEQTPWLAAWSQFDGIGIWRWTGDRFELLLTGLEMGLDQHNRFASEVQTCLLTFDAAAAAPALVARVSGLAGPQLLHGLIRDRVFERLATPPPAPRLSLATDSFVWDETRSALVYFPDPSEKPPHVFVAGAWQRMPHPFESASSPLIAAGWDPGAQRTVAIDILSRRSAAWDGKRWAALGNLPGTSPDAGTVLERSSANQQREKTAFVRASADGGLLCFLPSVYKAPSLIARLDGDRWSAPEGAWPAAWAAACYDAKAQAPLLVDALPRATDDIDEQVQEWGGHGRRTFAWIRDGRCDYLDGAIGRPAYQSSAEKRAAKAWPRAGAPDIAFSNASEPVHCFNPEVGAICVVEARLQQNCVFTLKDGTWTKHPAVFGKKKWSRNPQAAVMGWDQPSRTMFVVIGVDWEAKYPCWAILVAETLAKWTRVATLRHNTTDRTIGMGAAAVDFTWEPEARALVAAGSTFDDGHRWAIMRVDLGRVLDSRARRPGGPAASHRPA